MIQSSTVRTLFFMKHAVGMRIDLKQCALPDEAKNIPKEHRNKKEVGFQNQRKRT